MVSFGKMDAIREYVRIKTIETLISKMVHVVAVPGIGRDLGKVGISGYLII